jgi:oligogalacturonide lyase
VDDSIVKSLVAVPLLIGAAWASTMATSFAAEDAPVSNVGRRFPPEMKSYVDEVTGLTVTVLTSSDASDAKPYQTHTTWTADGQWIVFRSDRGQDDRGQQAFVVHETTGDIVQLTDDPRTRTGSLNLARKSMKMYYMRGGPQRRRRGESATTEPPTPLELVELNIGTLLADSLADAIRAPAIYERVIALLPSDLRDSGGFALDADEKVAYWGVAPADSPLPPRRQRRRRAATSEIGDPIPSRDELLERNTDPNETRDAARARFEAGGRGPGGIRSIDLLTGEVATVIDVDFRMGHVQTNPWQPGEIVYCHETGGDAPQRIWTVRSDGTGNRPLYVETPDEWVTHETVATRDEVMFNVMGHLPYMREKPTGIGVLNLRTGQMKLLGQVEEDMGRGRQGGFWHCNGSPDGCWAVGDTFRGNIFVIDRATGTRTLLTTDHKMRPDHAHPIFSPDSRRVLIQSGKLSNGENLDLMVVSLPEEIGKIP